MAAVVAKRLRTQQPQHSPEIDWSNSITEGLVFAYTCGNEAVGFGEDTRNVIPYVLASTGAPTGRPINTQSGTGGQLLSTSSAYLFANPTQTSVKSGVYSLFAFGTGPASGMQSALDDDDGTSRRFQFRLNAGKVELIPFYSGGNGDIIAPSALSAADLAAGFAMGATVNGTSAAIYQKGVKTAATLGGAVLTPNASINVGARKTGVSQCWLVGGLMLVAMWNRPLTDAEHASLSDNPWQLFKPARRRLWLAYSAGADATANITGAQSSSAAGTVTATGDASAAIIGTSAAWVPGGVTANGDATTTLPGVQATSAAGTISASGDATGALPGASATWSAGSVSTIGDALASITGASTIWAAGSMTATAGGSATTTLPGVQATSAAGTVTASGDASVTITGAAASCLAGAMGATGTASAAIVGAQIVAQAGTVTATGTSGSVTVNLAGVAMTSAAGTMTATGTRTTIEVSVTEDMICSAVRTYIKSIAPQSMRILRTPVNRASMPKDAYVSFTVGARRPLETNVVTYDPSGRFVKRSEQLTVQIDCYGVNSSNLAETLNVLFRDQYAADIFGAQAFEIAPLYAGDIQQAPFTNDADQYEDRYTFAVELQINSLVTVPQDSCNILGIDLVSVDANFPPTED